MKAVKGQTRCHWFGYTDICKNVYYFLIKTFFKKEYFLVHLYLFLGCRKLLETLWKMLSETESEGRRRFVKAWTPLHSGTGRSGQIQRPSSPWRRNSNLFNVCKEINRSWREKIVNNVLMISFFINHVLADILEHFFLSVTTLTINTLHIFIRGKYPKNVGDDD